MIKPRTLQPEDVVKKLFLKYSKDQNIERSILPVWFLLLWFLLKVLANEFDNSYRRTERGIDSYIDLSDKRYIIG